MEAVREKSKKKKKVKIKVNETERNTADDKVEEISVGVELVAPEIAQEVEEISEVKVVKLEESITKPPPDELNRILQKNKTIASTITENNPIITTSKANLVHSIKPYTESQLSALYTNTELESLQDFNKHFIEAELNGLATKQHSLYELLTNYQLVREKLAGNTIELEQVRKEYNNIQGDLWSLVKTTKTERSLCNDGVWVMSSYTYNKSEFHRSVFQTMARVLDNIQRLVYENHVLYSYRAEELKLQITVYLQTVITNCITVTQLPKHAPISLQMTSEPIHLKPYLTEIRLCISVLFAFQRKLIRDGQFVKETRQWLGQLVAVLLRLANFQDHLFLLNHILRCPAGVGTWASCYLQIPMETNVNTSPFSNFQVNHLLTILATILMPIKEREKFLEDIAQGGSKDATVEALWVIVDSDGEEDDEISGTSLRENDLVALMNQIPLDNLFRVLLLVSTKNFQDSYDSHIRTEHHLLRYLAFSTVLLRLFYQGLQTYDQPKYKQFAKRLSRFIRHIAQFATDQWELFRQNEQLDDKAMLQRLQVEYDAFFLRAIHCLFTSQKLGSWQFLAVVPYHMVSTKILWKIYYFLHTNDVGILALLDSDVEYSERLWEAELRSLFEEKLGGMSDDEVYYLLNTFANMALARDEVGDLDFVYAATMDLLEIGFIREATQDNCAKSSRILLSHITSKHPHLLSNILKTVKMNLDKIGALSLDLYADLPLTIWKITDDDVQLISKLILQNDIGSNESKLGRMILSRLDWDSLPYETHCDVAVLVVNAVDLQPGYLHWAWQTILRLKLHISDKGFKEIGRVMDVERYSILLKGIREQNPLASFVSVLMTTTGHLVPLIGSNGLTHLLLLQTHQKHEAVLFALYQIVPLFVNCQECIINCESFQQILSNLINADRGYISMAKSLISMQNTTVLQQFGNMIETQIVNFNYYDLESPRCLVRLWINSLVSIPNWNKDVGILYLLDVIIKASFFHTDALDVAYNILKELNQNSTPQEQTGAISSMFKWVTNTSVNGSLITTSLSSVPWLAYLMLTIEHEEREMRSGVWKELLLQLSRQKGKVNVDQALKKATSVVKVPVFTSAMLCIYRWAQQALDTPVDHPLLPLLWQRFFLLYLARMDSQQSCVGDKFFEGLVNFAFLKRLKRRLQETVDCYEGKLDESDVEAHVKEFLQLKLSLFRAFALWLEEPKLQDGNVFLPNLPPQYQPNLLGLIIQGNTAPWYEYLDHDTLKTDQQNCIKLWRISNFREKSNINQPLPNAGRSMEDEDPAKRILRRLSSYDAPKAPPKVSNHAPVVPPVHFGSKDEMFKSLELSFSQLKQFAHNHCVQTSEQKALDCTYKELLPNKYLSVTNKVERLVPCKGRNEIVNCSGAARITIQVQEARLNERIDAQIQSNRQCYESLLSKMLQTPALSLCTASVTIQQTIRILQSQVVVNPASSEMGVDLFYHILSLLTEANLMYLPTKTLFSSCLDKLGQSHICGFEKEMPRLLDKILHEPQFGCYLAPHFSPSNVGSLSLIHMYSTISKEISQKHDVTFALLSKFELDNWLTLKHPKISQRSQFIDAVIKALTTLGFDPPVEALMLHGLYRKHLLTVFEHQFPEHYTDVLVQLLRNSNGSSDAALLAECVWLDVINSLSRPNRMTIKTPLRDQLRNYALGQSMLHHQNFLETCQIFSKHFTQERLQYGLYGLYPKCRSYVEIFALVFGMAGCGLTVSMMRAHQGELPEVVAEKIWVCLREVFAPWLVPYSIQSLKGDMAAWIQQLADDRTVLLPWIPADGSFARQMIDVLTECVLFMITSLPTANNILSLVWHWYATWFTHSAIKEHILLPIHETLAKLPWHNFWPSIADVELMLRVVDQYLPESHTFLGHIFMSVPWTTWLSHQKPSPRMYQCLLNLLVKLLNEPNVRKRHAEKAKTLLVHAENFDWTPLEPMVYQHVMDWFVISCDSAVIFKHDPLDLDYRILQFLKTVSGYTKPVRNPAGDVLSKRLVYVKSHIKLISVFTSRHKTSVPSKETDLCAVITRQLSDLEQLVPSQEELNVLLHEILAVLNISCVSHVTLKVFSLWIRKKTGDDFVIRALLQTLGITVSDYLVLAELLEVTIGSYFENVVNESFEPNWKEIGDRLNIFDAKQKELEHILVDKGCVLTLNAVFLQRTRRCNNIEALLNLSLDWIANIKISESTEPKIPLIWSRMLQLSQNHCDKDEPTVGLILHKFAQILVQFADVKGTSSWGRGLLTAIGLNRQGQVSLHFRFLCRALAGYILAQLPDMKGEPQSVRHCSNAPCKVGQTGGNTECVKLLLSLDFGQSQGKIKECAELALKQIQDSNNSLHNAGNFLQLLLKQFYLKPYLNDV